MTLSKELFVPGKKGNIYLFQPIISTISSSFLCLDPFLHGSYGRCFGFNPSLMLTTTLDAKTVTPTLGEEGELIMHLRIDEEEYIRLIRAPTVLQTSGAKIYILPFNNPPNVMDEGYNVVPGLETKFELKAVGFIVVLQYDITVSLATFPSKQYSEVLGEEMLVHPKTVDNNWATMKDNVVKVSVSFGTFDITEIYEVPKYTVRSGIIQEVEIPYLVTRTFSQIPSVANDLGGALSLLLGICGIMILDIMMISSGGFLKNVVCPARKNTDAMSRNNKLDRQGRVDSNDNDCSDENNIISRPADSFWEVLKREDGFQSDNKVSSTSNQY
jgi:hypothetical protein